MGIINSNSLRLNVALARGLRTFQHWNLVSIFVGAALLLAVWWVAVPQMGQAQGTNTAPTAVADTAATAENTAVDINVVANDTDADGDTLSVTSVTTPANGTAVVTSRSTNTVTYTPDTDFNGTDSFNYTLSDATDTDIGTVVVTVGPPAQPTGFTATGADGQATLTWDDPSDSSITGYEYRLRAQVAKLTASDGDTGDQFGHSAAVDGDTMVVGAYRDDDNGTDSGAAYVFTRQSGTWSQVAKLTASDGAIEDYFGYSVAVEGDTVVVGAYRDDDNGTDSGSAYVFTKPGTGWTTTSTAAKLTASVDRDPALFDSFGFSVAVDGDTVVVGAYRDNDNGTDSGSAYVFTKPSGGWATGNEKAKLTASDGDDYDHFGYSVAVDEDTVVVGAYGDGSGSAYVFTKPGNGWVTTSTAAKLTASDGESNDQFGYSVAVDGDTVVVGARNDDDNGSGSGSAYLFTKPAAGWTTTSTAAKLTAFDGAADDRFGRSVAVDGDTVIVGASRDDDKGGSSGSAYLFTEPTSGGWATATETVKPTASDGAANDYFGISAAVDGDTVVVGAYQDDDKGSNSGSVYVYKVSDWTAIPNSASGQTNATSYTVTGLINDAEYDFRIRAVNAFAEGAASGIVTVTPTNTAPTAVDDTAVSAEDTAVDINVTANDTDPDFGATLSVTAVTTPSNGTAAIVEGSTTTVTYTPDADYNGTDSFEYTLSDGTDTDTGTVTVTVGPPAKPTELAATAGYGQAALTWDDPSDGSITGYEYMQARASKLTASDGAAADAFGFSVAVDGDTAVVGAFGDNATRGAAYLLTRQSGVWGQVAKLTASDGTATDHFGISVAVDGDTVVVGAYGDGSGSAYVFTKPGNGWVTTSTAAKLTASDGDTGDQFGYSVAVDGDTVVAGAPRDDDNGPTSGSAYVFTKPANGWVTTNTAAKLTASDGTQDDFFGESVAVDGDTVVVGAQGGNFFLANGAAYVFTKPADGWVTTSTAAKLTDSSGSTFEKFGDSVAVDGDTVVVGARRDYHNSVRSGAAFVFTKPADGWVTANETA